jgi:hypothetical protein
LRRPLNPRALTCGFVGFVFLQGIRDGVEIFQVSVFECLDGLNGLDKVGVNVDFGSDAFLADLFEAFTLFNLGSWVRVFGCPSAGNR